MLAKASRVRERFLERNQFVISSSSRDATTHTQDAYAPQSIIRAIRVVRLARRSLAQVGVHSWLVILKFFPAFFGPNGSKNDHRDEDDRLDHRHRERVVRLAVRHREPLRQPSLLLRCICRSEIA